MKGSDYFPISKFSAENYANLYRCPESAPPEKRARSLSAAKETPLSCAKAGNLGLNGSGRKDRIQQVCRGGATDEPQALRPRGNYGTEFSARQEEVIRRTSGNRQRLEKRSTGYRTTARRPARKTRKKAGKTTDGRQLMVSMEKVRKWTDRKRPG